MPAVDASHMGALKTLGEIVEYMQGLLGPVSSQSPTQSAPALTAPSLDLHALMISVVAEKTGYPAEMLEMGMDLEGDLGIDSIKRVEILASVQEQAPGMPAVDASHMGALKTLGEIVEYMQGLLGQDPSMNQNTVKDLMMPSDLGRFSIEMVGADPVGLTQPGLYGGHPVYITSSGDGLAEILAEALNQKNVNAIVTEKIPEDAEAVVFLGGLKNISTQNEALAIQKEAFQMARTLGRQLSKGPGLFVSIQDTGGAFGTTAFPQERAYLSGLSALVKTAAQEWPLASLKAIDLERKGRAPIELAQIIMAELLLGGSHIEVGLSAEGNRSIPRSFESTVQPESRLLSPDEIVVVSGGARGVTAACVIEWAKVTKGRFILLGRSRLEEEPKSCFGLVSDPELKRALLGEAKSLGQKLSPAELGKRVKNVLAGREIRSTLSAVSSAGGNAHYVSVDVTNERLVKSALTAIRAEWGPISGLLHGAGVLADRLIVEQTDAQFDWVFNTKVNGLRVLLSALSDDPLKVICFFSSVAARCGNKGQVAYAMANEILNKVAWAESRSRGSDVLVKSLGWGPWAGGMVSPQLMAHFSRLGVPMIPLEVGAKMLADELQSSNPHQVELVMGGEPVAGPLLKGGESQRSLDYELHLNHTSHPYLAGHSIKGDVIVPVVLVLEWFSRLARASCPNLHLESIYDLKVLKGIKLIDFKTTGDRILLSCKALDAAQGTMLGLELKGPSGRLYYSAQAKMVVKAQPFQDEDDSFLAMNDWGDASIYGDVLFHSKEFQVIEEMDGIGENGISGTLKGVENADWSWEKWDTDVAAMDGGLQMLLLWARDKMGGAALPMGIGQAKMPISKPQSGPIHCFARCRSASPLRGLADVYFQDQNGKSISEFKNVELILRPDSPSAK